METEHPAVPQLIAQHREIADLFRRIGDSTGSQRRAAFRKLRRLMAVHETAEELLVHPRLRWVDSTGDVQARVRTEEEEQIKAALLELETCDVDSAEFSERLEALRAITLAHSGAEETEEFPALERGLDDKQRDRLRHRITAVEKVAPTRPHPGLTLGGENVLAGGATAVVDRVRDLIRPVSRRS